MKLRQTIQRILFANRLGIPEIDNVCKGFQSGDLLIIKTAAIPLDIYCKLKVYRQPVVVYQQTIYHATYFFATKGWTSVPSMKFNCQALNVLFVNEKQNIPERIILNANRVFSFHYKGKYFKDVKWI